MTDGAIAAKLARSIASITAAGAIVMTATIGTDGVTATDGIADATATTIETTGIADETVTIAIGTVIVTTIVTKDFPSDAACCVLF